MKHLTLFILSFMWLAFGAQAQIGLPLDFESTTLDYTFTNFDGGDASKVANPQSNGLNTSGSVGKMVKGAGQPWGGALITLGSPMDFSTNKTFKVKVFMPKVGAKLLLKVEGLTDAGVNFEKEVTGTKANEWEELTFDYSGIDASKQYQKLVFIFDLGTVGDGSANFTYLFDDVLLTTSGGGTTDPQPALPLDFESTTLTYTFTNFDGGDASKSANPQISGINTSTNAGKMVKGAGQPWGGSWIALDKPIDFSANKTFKMKVLMPKVGAKVLLKVENMTDGSIAFEKEATGTKANEWEELTFDYSAIDASKQYQKLVLIFDLGTVGDGSANFTYFFDDIMLSGGGGPGLAQMDLPVNFDEETVEYGLVGFGGADNATVVQDPTNAANKVAKVVKAGNAEVWAGTTITTAAGLGFKNKVPFTEAEKKMNVRVWSPNAGIVVRLKLEDHADNTKTVETDVTTTMAGTWEVLTFDFATHVEGTSALNLGTNYDKASIFFNFGVSGTAAGEKTYYFDDVKFGAGSTDGGGGGNAPALPLDFESTTADYTFNHFGGADASKVANPQIGGINTSANVARMVKNAGGEPWGGSWLALDKPMDFSTNKTFKVKVFMPRAGATLRLKVENMSDGGIFYEKDATGTKANEWEELEFNFNAIDASKSYQKIVLIFDFGTAGDGSANSTYLLDDLVLTTGAAPLPSLPLDFESATADYTFTSFGGGEVSKVANAQSNGINTSANVGQMVKNAGEPWGGSFITLDKPIDLTKGKTFNVKVFMPKVGAKILLKLENLTDGAIFLERELSGTKANEWEELSFDFSALDGAKEYQKVVLIFDNGTMGDGSANFTYLFDDILQTGEGQTTKTQMSLPVTFDEEDVDYSLVGFGGAENATIVVDPTNSENKVAKVVKVAGAETWAGTTITDAAQRGFSSKIPFTAEATKMNVRVWSPDAGIKVRLKVEDHTDNTKTVETEATTTKANGWETLTFNFATPAAGTAAFNLATNYNKASIFFNFGASGAEKVYYFDDVMFGEGPTTGGDDSLPTLPLDFESDTLNYTFTNFDGGDASKVANPQSSGINTSASVGKMVKNAGQVWGGAWIALDQPMDFSTNKTFKVKVFMPRVGAKLLLKVEHMTDGAIAFEKEATGTKANEWEELTFDYSTIDASKQYQKLVLIFDLGTAGDGSANFTYLFDDVMLGTATVVPQDQTIAFTALADKTVGDAPFALTATASSGLAVTYTTASANISIAGSTVTVTAAGRASITANQAGNAGFNAATAVTQSFCVKPAKPGVTVSGMVLTSNATAGNQWFLGSTAITGATGATFTATAAGNYRVQVTVDDCVSEFSDITVLEVTGLIDTPFGTVAVYPNPATDYLAIQGLPSNFQKAVLFDLVGKVHAIALEKVGDVYQANVSHLAQGVYLLQIQVDNKGYQVRIVKQ